MCVSEFDYIDVGRTELIWFCYFAFEIEKGVSVGAYFGCFLDECHFVYEFL